MRNAFAQSFLDSDWMAKQWACLKHGLPLMPPRILVNSETPETNSSSTTETTTTTDSSQGVPNPMTPDPPAPPTVEPVSIKLQTTPAQPTTRMIDEPKSSIPTWAKVGGASALIAGPLLGAAGLYYAMNPPKPEPIKPTPTIIQQAPNYGDLIKYLDEHGYATGDRAADGNR